MGPSSARQFSELLIGWGRGESRALEAILPLVYDELRRAARNHLRQQRSNHTLQTTALVHEVYLRLAQQKSLRVENRSHFLGIAAQLMRWILVDYEKSRRAVKRGAGLTLVTFDQGNGWQPAHQPSLDVLALNEALERLAKLDPRQGQIVELRYFGGLSLEDTAKFLGISPATVKRSWASARAWLLREMSRSELNR